MEEWRDVVGFEGWYQISNLGRVKRIKAGPGATVGRILKSWNAKGYSQIELNIKGSSKRVSVHKLVLEAFISPRPLEYECNHKNGNKTDNRIRNLEWVTASENRWHACHVLGKGIGATGSNAKLSEEEVLNIRGLYATGDYTKEELGNIFGCCTSNIHQIVTRLTWKHI